MKKFMQKAFTLVELLIVIGIIGILAVILLVTLNPAEAQRKARDAKRIKDASTLQVIMEQAVADNLIKSTDAIANAGVNSTTVRMTQADCGVETGSTNWLGFKVCDYAKSIPVDPLNGYTTNVNNGAGGTLSTIPMYKIKVVGIDYEINVRQESSGNTSRLTGDGGDSAKWFEIASGSFSIYSVLDD